MDRRPRPEPPQARPSPGAAPEREIGLPRSAPPPQAPPLCPSPACGACNPATSAPCPLPPCRLRASPLHAQRSPSPARSTASLRSGSRSCTPGARDGGDGGPGRQGGARPRPPPRRRLCRKGLGSAGGRRPRSAPSPSARWLGTIGPGRSAQGRDTLHRGSVPPCPCGPNRSYSLCRGARPGWCGRPSPWTAWEGRG